VFHSECLRVATINPIVLTPNIPVLESMLTSITFWLTPARCAPDFVCASLVLLIELPSRDERADFEKLPSDDRSAQDWVHHIVAFGSFDAVT